MGEQRHADAGDEDERGREPGGEHAGPRVEPPLGERGVAAGRRIDAVEVAVIVHDHHADECQCTGDVGADQTFASMCDRRQG